MTGIFYGSTMGNTESLAADIAKELGIASSDVHNVSNVQAEKVAGYDSLLLGSSTWGLGDLQDDWESFVGKLSKQDLSGKKVAFFGCGDSSAYPDTFCDAVGILKEALRNTGCIFIGEMDASGYSSTESKAFEGDAAIGLLVDDDEPGQTAGHMGKWLGVIRKEI